MSVKLRGCTCALSNMDLNRGALPRPYILWLSWAVLESGWYPKTCQFKGVTSAFPEETPHTESILIILVPSVRGDFVNYIPKLFPWEDYHHIRYSPQIYSSPPPKKKKGSYYTTPKNKQFEPENGGPLVPRRFLLETHHFQVSAVELHPLSYPAFASSNSHPSVLEWSRMSLGTKKTYRWYRCHLGRQTNQAVFINITILYL